MKTALTIAGSDNSGGAGIQADLKTFSYFKVFGTSAITSITSQNSKGVIISNPVDSEILYSQISSILEDFTIDAVKIGMIQTKENLNVIYSLLKKFNLENIVLDTIIKSSSGKYLLDLDALEDFKKSLIPLSYLITPNTEEASVLVGYEIENLNHMKKAVKDLYKLGAKNVYLKGGHIKFENKITDIFFDGSEIKQIKYKKINLDSQVHGTGCVLSSAIAANLALGYDIQASIKKARRFLQKQILASKKLGSGYRYMPVV